MAGKTPISEEVEGLGHTSSTQGCYAQWSFLVELRGTIHGAGDITWIGYMQGMQGKHLTPEFFLHPLFDVFVCFQCS